MGLKNIFSLSLAEKGKDIKEREMNENYDRNLKILRKEKE